MTNYKRSGGRNIGLKVYAAITSILLAAAVTVTAVGFGTGWWKIVPKDEQEQVQPDDQTPDETPDDEGGAVIGEGEANGISLMSARIAPEDFEAYGVSPLAETAGTITATVSPSNATDKSLNWSVAWKNASSSWATGKTVTDYFTVTPSSDGATTANWQCLKGFSEPIVVTATSRSNPDVSGTVNVDYVKRITSLTASFSATELKFDTTYNVTFTPVYSEGTLQGTVTSYTNADIQLTEGFKDAIEAKMKDGYAETLTYYDPAHFTYDSEEQTFTFSTGSSTSPFLAFAKSSAPKPSFGDPADKITDGKVRDDFNNSFTLTAGEYDDTQAIFTIDYVYSYNGTQYSTGTASINLKFDAEDLIITATSIDLGEDIVI